MSSTKIALREISSEIGMAFLWVGDWEAVSQGGPSGSGASSLPI